MLKKFKKDYIKFDMFFAIWASEQGWDIPKFHLRILRFLKNYEEWENNTGILEIFRNGGKSTIVGIFIAWMLFNDSSLRFLVLSANLNTSKKVVADVKFIIKNHPLTKDYLFNNKNIWQADHFWVESDESDPRSPSVCSYGISASITGSRADFLICDDIEVPKNSKTENLRSELRVKISEGLYILNPGCPTLFVGTPHTFDTIYEEKIQSGATVLKIPLLKNIDPNSKYPYLKGESNWPSRFTKREINKRQLAEKSKSKFLSQYQLLPQKQENVFFDIENLKYYSSEIVFKEIQEFDFNAGIITKTCTFLGDIELTKISVCWDPSAGKVYGDDSVLAIVFLGSNNEYYVHRTIRLAGDILAQCKTIKENIIKYKIPKIQIETNGIGGFAPAILKKQISDLHCQINEKFQTANKFEKINEAFEIPLSLKLINISENVKSSKFFGQLCDYQGTSNAQRQHTLDDYIDSVSECILSIPVIYKSNGKMDDDFKNVWGRNTKNIEMQMDEISF